MASVKLVRGDYTIQTVSSGDTITLDSTNVNINGVLTLNAGTSGPGLPTVVVEITDSNVSSATPANIGSLQFTALGGSRYAFDSYITIVPSTGMTVAPAVNFSAGTCNYTTEVQTTSTSAYSVAAKTTSDNVSTTYAMTGTDARTLKISGTFYHTANVTVALRFQNSTGNATVKAGSYLSYQKLT